MWTTKKILSGALLLSLMVILPACNTVKGVGKDIHDSTQNFQTWMEHSNENRQMLASDARPDFRNRY